jgi:hypothetical protein
MLAPCPIQASQLRQVRLAQLRESAPLSGTRPRTRL